MAETFVTTDRLILRDWRAGDSDRFYDIMNTPAVMQHLGGLQTREQWAAAHQRILGFERDHGHSFWIVEDRAAGDMLGFCGIKRVNAPGAGMLTGQHEIGWRLREAAWGRGIAKEAAIASLDLAFGRLAAPHMLSMTIPANLPSQGLMHRLGMSRRADLDFEDTRFGPELNPALIWRLDADHWPAARAAALAPRGPGS